MHSLAVVIFLILAGFVLMIPITIVVKFVALALHEAAHLCVALILGKKVSWVRIGSPNFIVASFSLGSIPVKIGFPFTGGGTSLSETEPSFTLSRGELCVTAAGPVMNLLVGSFLFLIYFSKIGLFWAVPALAVSVLLGPIAFLLCFSSVLGFSFQGIFGPVIASANYFGGFVLFLLIFAGALNFHRALENFHQSCSVLNDDPAIKPKKIMMSDGSWITLFFAKKYCPGLFAENALIGNAIILNEKILELLLRAGILFAFVGIFSIPLVIRKFNHSKTNNP